MIPLSFLNVSILLLQLFFNSQSPLQIPLNPSPISIPYTTNRNSTPSPMPVRPQKTLQRVPHVFSQVLELPLRSNADVLIEDRSDCFRFTANVAINAEVRAYAVKLHPAVTKVVVREGIRGGEVELLLEKLEVDVWRFRLPEMLRPEMATAVVVGRKLVVTVPKGGRRRRGGDGRPEVQGGGRAG